LCKDLPARMGRLFVVDLEGKIYSCKHCRTHLALYDDIVSKVIFRTFIDWFLYVSWLSRGIFIWVLWICFVFVKKWVPFDGWLCLSYDDLKLSYHKRFRLLDMKNGLDWIRGFTISHCNDIPFFIRRILKKN
jgi:hypothetical protein